MPTYSYRDAETGEPVEITVPLKVYEERLIDRTEVEWEGRTLIRDVTSDHIACPKSGTWPLLSDAAGVLPSQVDEAHRVNASQGIDLQYASDGRAIFRDRAHRKQVLRQLGMHDKQGGYGD